MVIIHNGGVFILDSNEHEQLEIPKEFIVYTPADKIVEKGFRVWHLIKKKRREHIIFDRLSRSLKRMLREEVKKDPDCQIEFHVELRVIKDVKE